MSGRVVLGRYRVVAPLARGGMGIIYLGRLEGAAGFAKPVVIKTVIPDTKDDRSAQLFAREARIVSNLQHPNIVGVLDFGEAHGEYVMVLEYVHGFHLGTWARYVQEARGHMPVAHAVEVMLPALDALDYAHRLQRPDGTPLGIVHRDVSPANILLDHLGNVKLHDFGIARMADDEYKTQDGSFRGTLSFTAPETLQGVPASPSSDLYACGVVLYQLISGSNPFRGQQPSETLHRVMTYVPPPLGEKRSDVAPALDAAIARSLEKDPEQRFKSAGDFAAALRAARTWDEEQGALELERTIHDDFMGSHMSELLGLETLQARDAAWRESQPSGQRLPLSSSPPPRRSGWEQLTATTRVPLEQIQVDGAATMQALPGDALLQLARRDAQHNQPVLAAPEAVGEARPRSASRAWLLSGGVVLAVVGAAAVSYQLWRAKAAEPAPKFLLIEKQVDAEPATPIALPAGSATPSAATSAAAPASAAPALPVGAQKTARPSDASASGSSLTSSFQRQRGRIEACFRSHAGEGEQPQLTVRFQLEASGVVRSAELQPAALAGTALGGCVLGVARSTRSPPGDGPVTFTIPITARKSSR